MNFMRFCQFFYYFSMAIFSLHVLQSLWEPYEHIDGVIDNTIYQIDDDTYWVYPPLPWPIYPAPLLG